MLAHQLVARRRKHGHWMGRTFSSTRRLDELVTNNFRNNLKLTCMVLMKLAEIIDIGRITITALVRFFKFDFPGHWQLLAGNLSK